jgi:hypothetical protein
MYPHPLFHRTRGSRIRLMTARSSMSVTIRISCEQCGRISGSTSCTF